jgi:hypothetical protein
MQKKGVGVDVVRVSTKVCELFCLALALCLKRPRSHHDRRWPAATAVDQEVLLKSTMTGNYTHEVLKGRIICYIYHLYFARSSIMLIDLSPI